MYMAYNNYYTVHVFPLKGGGGENWATRFVWRKNTETWWLSRFEETQI
jgi:hypothetical protein